jgi:hypothetical protein
VDPTGRRHAAEREASGWDYLDWQAAERQARDAGDEHRAITENDLDDTVDDCAEPDQRTQRQYADRHLGQPAVGHEAARRRPRAGREQAGTPSRARSAGG